MARHAHNPAAPHWKAARKVIAYIKATKDLGAVFRWRGELKLSLLADENYADRCNERSLVSGGVVMLGDITVSVSSTASTA